MGSWLRLIAIVLSLSILGASFEGCSASHPLNVIKGEQMSATAEAALISKLKLKAQEIKSYRGLVQARFQGEGSHQAFRYVIVFEQPDKLRLEVLPTLGAYALQLMVMRDGFYTFLDTTEKQAWRGNDPAGALARLLRLRLSPSELISYLTGCIPDSVLESTTFSKLVQDEKSGTITLAADSGVWILDSQLLVLRRAKLMDKLNNKVRLELALADYRDIDQHNLPGQVTLKIVERDMLLMLKPQVPTINQTISENLFTTTIPEGYSIHEGGLQSGSDFTFNGN